MGDGRWVSVPEWDGRSVVCEDRKERGVAVPKWGV